MPKFLYPVRSFFLVLARLYFSLRCAWDILRIEGLVSRKCLAVVFGCGVLLWCLVVVFSCGVWL